MAYRDGIEGDAAARKVLGGAGGAAFLGGLGVIVPSWNDLLLAFVNKVVSTQLYELPPALGWVLIVLGGVMLLAAFFGPTRIDRWVGGGKAGAKSGSLIVLRHLGFLPAVRAPTGDELAGPSGEPEVIDLSIDLGAPLQAGNVDQALAEHQARMTVLEAMRAVHPKAGLAYGGIVQAPFQVLAGYRLSSWTAVALLEWDRARHHWCGLRQGKGPNLGLARTDEPVSAAADVAIALEISYPIATPDIIMSVPAVGRIVRLSLTPPRLDALTHMEQATEISAATRVVLDELAPQLRAGGRVHLFIAGPMSVGFRVGQLVSRTLHPLVHVYSYSMNNNPPYAWGLLINPVAGGPVVVRP